VRPRQQAGGLLRQSTAGQRIAVCVISGIDTRQCFFRAIRGQRASRSKMRVILLTDGLFAKRTEPCKSEIRGFPADRP